MALSSDAIKIVAEGGKAAAILREIESIKLTLQSVAQQQAKLNEHFCDLKTLELRVKDARETFWSAQRMLHQVQVLLRDMQKEFYQKDGTEKKTFGQKLKSIFFTDAPKERAQPVDYDEDEDSDF